ncbi:MAG: trimeric intracellular cation channel family protein [Wolinella sp.]
MEYFWIFDMIGLVAFAVSGFLVGVRRNLDILGVMIAGFTTAIGGGIVRDAISGQVPFVFKEYYPALTILCTLVAVLFFRLHRRDHIERGVIFIVMDAIGLVAFSIAGAMVGIKYGFNSFGVVVLAFTTAVGGGMLRDVMINEIPFVLVSEFYGTVAILCAILLTFIQAQLGSLPLWTIILVAGIGLMFRLFGYFKGWQLPKIG